MLPRATSQTMPRWQLSAMLATPLRVQLVVGGLCWLALSVWWWLSWAGATVLRPDLHGLLMVWGFLPPFVAGFLAAVRPRWLDLPVPDSSRWRTWALVHMGGVLAVLASSRLPPLLILGMGALALALMVWSLDHARACAISQSQDRLHAVAVGVSLGVLMLTIGWATAALLSAPGPGLHAAILAGFWGGLLPCFVVALDRMTALVRPWLGWVLALLLLRAGTAGADPATDLPLLRCATGSIQLTMGLALLASGLDHRRQPRRHNRVTGWTLVAAAWGSVGLLLDGMGLLCRWPMGNSLALHVLALGFMGGLWLTMGSRAAAAEIGRAQALSAAEWWLLVLLQAVVILRVLAAWPAMPASLTTWAAGALAMLAWAWCAHWARLLGEFSPDQRYAALP